MPSRCTSLGWLDSYACTTPLTYLTFRLPSHFCDIGYRGWWLPPPRFSVYFKILYRVIQHLIQHCLLSTMVYLDVTYIIATQKYEFF